MTTPGSSGRRRWRRSRSALINLRVDDAACLAAADALYAKLTAAGVEVLYDDRDERGGAKFATADLIGLPWQLVIGPKGVAAGTVELKRRGGEREELSVEAALEQPDLTPSPLRGGRLGACAERGGGPREPVRATPTPLAARVALPARGREG